MPVEWMKQLNRFQAVEVAEINRRNRHALADMGKTTELLFSWLGVAVLTALVSASKSRPGSGWMIAGGYIALLAFAAWALIPIMRSTQKIVPW